MPMHLADAARSQPHVDAGDGVGNREIRLRDLARPTAVLNASWRIVECRPAKRHGADVGWRRRKSRWKLVPDGRILRTGIGDAPGICRVDCPLGRVIRVAE